MKSDGAYRTDVGGGAVVSYIDTRFTKLSRIRHFLKSAEVASADFRCIRHDWFQMRMTGWPSQELGGTVVYRLLQQGLWDGSLAAAGVALAVGKPRRNPIRRLTERFVRMNCADSLHSSCVAPH